MTKKDDDTLTAIDLEECKEISDKLKILSRKLYDIYRKFTDFINQECPKYFSEENYKYFKEKVEYGSYTLCRIIDDIEEYADEYANYIYMCSERQRNSRSCNCMACIMNRFINFSDDLF